MLSRPESDIRVSKSRKAWYVYTTIYLISFCGVYVLNRNLATTRDAIDLSIELSCKNKNSICICDAKVSFIFINHRLVPMSPTSNAQTNFWMEKKQTIEQFWQLWADEKEGTIFQLPGTEDPRFGEIRWFTLCVDIWKLLGEQQFNYQLLKESILLAKVPNSVTSRAWRFCGH